MWVVRGLRPSCSVRGELRDPGRKNFLFRGIDLSRSAGQFGGGGGERTEQADQINFKMRALFLIANAPRDLGLTSAATINKVKADHRQPYSTSILIWFLEISHLKWPPARLLQADSFWDNFIPNFQKDQLFKQIARITIAQFWPVIHYSPQEEKL